MPGCAAVGCSNSSEKGYLMKRFPRDPTRRKYWAIATKRANWIPTDSSVLCEVHFEPEMWEVTREDGSRRLRCDALPTIFSFTKIKQERKRAIPSASYSNLVRPTDKPQKTHKINCGKIIKLEHSYADLTSLPIDTSTSHCSSEPSESRLSLPSNTKTRFNNLNNLSDEKLSDDHRSISQTPTCKEKLLLYEKLLNKKKVLLQKYKTKLRYFRTRCKLLEKRLKVIQESGTNEEATILHNLFENDQITALKKRSQNISTKFMKWSNETIMRGLELKLQCGSSGYDELLKQNFPFPSVRTLQRRLESRTTNFQEDCEIKKEIMD